MRMQNAKIINTDDAISTPRPYRMPVEVGQAQQPHAFMRLAKKRPVSSRQMPSPSGRDTPAQNPKYAERSVLPRVALESTAWPISPAADSGSARRPAGDEEVRAVAVDLAGHEQAHHEDEQHADGDAGDDHVVLLFGRWPARTRQPRVSQMTRVAISDVISALS